MRGYSLLLLLVIWTFAVAYQLEAFHDELKRDCSGIVDACGVCNGQNTTCMCVEYLGYDLADVDYALLRWSVAASMIKVNDTLDLLYKIRHLLPGYQYQSNVLSLVNFIDTLHQFCDHCLDSFDFAQVGFADLISS